MAGQTTSLAALKEVVKTSYRENSADFFTIAAVKGSEMVGEALTRLEQDPETKARMDRAQELQQQLASL